MVIALFCFVLALWIGAVFGAPAFDSWLAAKCNWPNADEPIPQDRLNAFVRQVVFTRDLTPLNW